MITILNRVSAWLVRLQWLLTALLLVPMAVVPALAQQADLEVNTPAIAALKQSMQARHAMLAPHYDSGAVGLTHDGLISVRNPAALPLSQRQAVNLAVADENKDRNALYREIARANNQPGWESDIRTTFAQRWISKAQPGWWVQSGSGGWTQK